ncbi:MAG: hypothetical protein KF760_23030 [Candidatus Eremiobacteraeota bacterium]|nr:hypothetical protein [Candidatus Eremiobacteraeota bacterium]MCW5868386.1 hypothetical protein [Candidatus Eremiobacteraeota bacterium]
MITQTPFSQAIRDRFSSWSQGRSSLNANDLEKLFSDPKASGEELALLAAAREFGQELSPATLDQYEQTGGARVLEARYRDNLERLQTPRSLFPQGGPDFQAVTQGKEQNCVLTSTCISLAQQRPACLTQLLSETESGVVLRLPGEKERCVAMPTDRELLTHSCAYQNGAWMTILSRELGSVGALKPSKAVQKVTGHKVDQDLMMATSEAALRKKLESAMEKHQVVIAGRGGFDEEVQGLTRNHSYAVIGYDPNFARVRLQDPEGNEPLDADGKARDGDYDGQFSLSVKEFKSWFSSIHYEETDKPSFWGSFFDKLKDSVVGAPAGGGVPVSG